MIIIDTWKGLVTNASPYAVPIGAAVTQSNFQCRRPGELSARNGQASVTIATHAGTTVPIVEMFRAPLAGVEAVVYQNASGHIFVAKGIS
jgi:hypothetical protein